MTNTGSSTPSLDWDGKLVRIITRADLVGPSRTDSEIEREIREDIVGGTLGRLRQEHRAGVHRGEVTLSGKLERRTDAELLGDFVAYVPGVVSVSSTVTWVWDDRDAALEPHVPRR
jgi:osmotically-inducible protein OsmY